MRIIGIDPGVATTGWAVLDFEGREMKEVLDYGVIETEKGCLPSARLKEIHEDLKKILVDYSPEIAGVESLIFCNNAKTVMRVGEARGVVLLSLEEHNIEIYDFTPLQVKSSISGYGNATKCQVQENVKRMCNFKEIPKPDDAADAIAIAICCNDSLVLNNICNFKTFA